MEDPEIEDTQEDLRVRWMVLARREKQQELLEQPWQEAMRAHSPPESTISPKVNWAPRQGAAWEDGD